MPLAIVPCHNEIDILPWILSHLKMQGFDIYLLDNWSDDGSYEIAGSYTSLRERWPATGLGQTWQWEQQLQRVEEIAQTYRGWVMFNDSDEINRSSRIHETAARGFERIEREGYNAIAFRRFEFPPIDNGYLGDPEQYFRYYSENFGIQNVKAWLSWGQRVNLHWSGGHIVGFAERRLTPEHWIMKHYGFRSQSHGERKLAMRLARYSPEERARGWHRHYDGIGTSVLANPAELKEWPRL